MNPHAHPTVLHRGPPWQIRAQPASGGGPGAAALFPQRVAVPGCCGAAVALGGQGLGAWDGTTGSGQRNEEAVG